MGRPHLQLPSTGDNTYRNIAADLRLTVDALDVVVNQMRLLGDRLRDTAEFLITVAGRCKPDGEPKGELRHDG
jgi:hypothetical protein